MSKIDLEIKIQADKAKDSIDDLTRSTSSASMKLIALDSAISIAQKALNGLAKGLGYFVDEAVKVEDSMSEIATLFDGDVSDSMEKVEKQLKELQVRFGSSFQSQAKAYYQAISSGAVKASTAVKLLTLANKLAIGGITTTEIAVDGLTNVLNGYAMSAADLESISDSIFIGMKAGKTTVGELSKELGKIGAISKIAGVSFQEVVAATSALTLNSYSTSESTQKLKALFTEIVKPADKLAEAIKKTGFESGIALVKTKGLQGALEALKKVSGGTEGLAQIFGSSEALQGALTVVSSQSEKYKQILLDQAEAAKEAGKATDEAFGKKDDTLSQNINQLKESFNELAADIGKDFLPALKEIVSFSADFVRGIKENKQAIYDWAGGFSLMTASFAASTVAGLGLLKTFMSVETAFITLGTSLINFAKWSTTSFNVLQVLAAVLMELYKPLSSLIILVGKFSTAFVKIIPYLNVAIVKLNILTKVLKFIPLLTIISGFWTLSTVLYKFIFHTERAIIETYKFAFGIRDLLLPVLSSLNELFIRVNAKAIEVQSSFIYLTATLMKMASYLAGPIIQTMVDFLTVMMKTTALFDKGLSESIGQAIIEIESLRKGWDDTANTMIEVAESTYALATSKEYLAGRIKRAQDELVAEHYEFYKNIEAMEEAADSGEELADSTEMIAETHSEASASIEKTTGKVKGLKKEINELINVESDYSGFGLGIDVSPEALTRISEAEDSFGKIKKHVLNLDIDESLIPQNDDSIKAYTDRYIENISKIADAFNNLEAIKNQGSDLLRQIELINKDDELKKIADILGYERVAESLLRQERLEEEGKFADARKEHLDLLAEYELENQKEVFKERVALSRMSFYEKVVYYAKKAYDEVKPYLSFKTILESSGEYLKEFSLWMVDAFSSVDIGSIFSGAVQWIKALPSLGKVWGGFTEGLGDTWDYIKSGWQGVYGYLSSLTLSDVFDGITSYLSNIGEALDDLAPLAMDFFLAFSSFTLNTVYDQFFNLMDMLESSFDYLYDSVGSIASFLQDSFMDALNFTSSFINGDFIDSVKDAFASLSDIPQNLVDSMAGLSTTVSFLGEDPSEHINRLKAAIKELEDAEIISEDDKVRLEEMKRSLEDLLETQDQFFSVQLRKFTEAAPKFVDELLTNLPKIVQKLNQDLPSIIDTLVSSFEKTLPSLADSFLSIATTLVDKLVVSMPLVVSALVKELPKVITALSKKLPSIITSMTSIFSSIIDGTIKEVPKLIKAINENLPTIIDNVADLIKKIIPQISDLLIATIPTIFNAVLKVLPGIVDSISKELPKLIPELAKLASSFITSILSSFTKSAPDIISSLVRELPSFLSSMSAGLVKLIPVLTESIVASLPKIVDALLKHLPPVINEIVKAVPQIISAVLKELPRVIEQLISSAGNFINSMIKELPKFITQLLASVPTIISELAREIPRIIQSVVRAIPEIILAITNSLPSIIRALVDAAPQMIAGLILALPQLVSALAQKAPEIIQSLVRSFPELVRGMATYAPNIMAEIVRQLPQIIGSIISSLPQIMSAIIRMIPSLLYSIAAEFPLHLYNAMRNLGNQVWYAIRDGVNSIGSAIESLFKIPASAWGKGTVENFLGIDLPWVRFAEGGHVGGTAKVAGNSLKNDVIPAMLSPGEFVLDRETIQNGDTSIIQTLAQQGVLSPSALEGMGFQLHGFGGWITNIWDTVKDWAGSAGDILGNVGSGVLNGLQAGASGAWKWIKTGTGQVVKWGRNALPDIWDLLKQLGGGVFESAKAIWDYNRNAINVWDVLSNPFSVIKNAFNGIMGGLMKKNAGGIVRGMMGMANGGIVPGTSKVRGDSKINDTVATMLSPGELVIPSSFVQNGMAGIIDFASKVLGANSTMPSMAYGGVSASLPAMSGRADSNSMDSGLVYEFQEIKQLLQNLGYHLSKNTLDSKKVLERWDYEGMPKERNF